MAYVAKSQRAFLEIAANIKKLFVERKDHADDWANYVDDPVAFAEKCYRLACSEETEKNIRTLPKGWVEYTDRFSFSFVVTPTDDEKSLLTRHNTKIHSVYPTTFSKERPQAHNWSRGFEGIQCKIPEENIPKSIRDMIIRREKQKLAVITDERNMLEGAEALYTKAKSINQFVKLWEPALSLLDSETSERLRKRTTRSATPEDQGISKEELDKLNAGYVKAKVSQ